MPIDFIKMLAYEFRSSNSNLSLLRVDSFTDNNNLWNSLTKLIKFTAHSNTRLLVNVTLSQSKFRYFQ